MTRVAIPELCYVVVPGAPIGARIGIIKHGEKGYHLTSLDLPQYSTDAVKEFVDHMNGRLDVTPAEAEAMLMGSMFGWDVPGAQMPERVT